MAPGRPSTCAMPSAVSMTVPTSVAVYWGEDLGRRVANDARKAGMSADDYAAAKGAPEQLVQALAAAVDRLESDFGSWKTPWGEINRYQRINGALVQPFDDSKPSIPVGFTSARWGSLASFGARTYNGTKKMYGTTGNSFVAVVEVRPDGTGSVVQMRSKTRDDKGDIGANAARIETLFAKLR